MGGIVQIVQGSGYGKTSDCNEFDFDLSELPYDIALRVLRYVEHEARPMIKAERNRERVLKKRAE